MSIHINIHGGHAVVGAVSHGHAATVTGTATLNQAGLDRACARAALAIAAAAREQGRSDAELAAVLKQLQELKAQAQSAPAASSRAGGVLKLLRENFPWAWPAVKDLAALAWPALLAALSG